MNKGDWQSSLQVFLNSNPELPEGEEITEAESASETKQPRLDIILEKKGRAGKMATIVTGFVLDDAIVSEIASTMKTRLGTGGSSRGGEILIQGDRRKDVLDFLVKAGYKARII